MTVGTAWSDAHVTGLRLTGYREACGALIATLSREIQRLEDEEPERMPEKAFGLAQAVVIAEGLSRTARATPIPLSAEGLAEAIEEALVAHFGTYGPLFGTEHSVGCIRNAITHNLSEREKAHAS